MSKECKAVHYDGVYKIPVKDADGDDWFISIDYQALIAIVTDGYGHDRESHIDKIEDVEVSLESVIYGGEFEWTSPNSEMAIGIEKDIEWKFSRGLIE